MTDSGLPQEATDAQVRAFLDALAEVVAEGVLREIDEARIGESARTPDSAKPA